MMLVVMTYAEIEQAVREAAAQQPRGWQSALAARLDVAVPSVAQVLSGKRRIPPEHLHVYLDTLGLELIVKNRNT